MLLDRAHYHAWGGKLGSPWLAALALTRVTLMQVVRRKAYWFVVLLGLGNFLKAAVGVYVLAQFSLPPQMRDVMLERFGFSADAKSGQETGYTRFMDQQSLVVMLLLAFSGSLLVGADFRQQAMPFYLSRRIDRRHYIGGKLIAISALILLVTVAPTIVLFIEYGLLTSSFDYWWENVSVLGAIFGYGLVLCGVLSTLLAAISAWLERAGPIAIAWCSLFMLLNRLAPLLAEPFKDDTWLLIDPWYDMHCVSALFFGKHAPAEQRELAPQAAAVLFLICSLAMAALVRRVRAVDVVR